MEGMYFLNKNALNCLTLSIFQKASSPPPAVSAPKPKGKRAMDAFLEEIKKWALNSRRFSFLKELSAGTKLKEKLSMPVMVRIFSHHAFSSIHWVRM